MLAVISGRFLALLALLLLPLGLGAQSKLLGGPPQARTDAAPQPMIANSVGIAYPQYLWPPVNGGIPIVYYVIDAQSDPNATPNIEAAIATFNADFKGVIQWMPWSSTLGPYYVDILLDASNLSGQCESLVGYQATAGQMMGGATNCTIGTLLHEMGHVIGLWHEHQRADRATYVNVNYGSVIKGSWGNFVILADDVQILSSYDYASVMQYIPFAFSRNGGVVIESIPAGIPLAGYEGVPSLACPPAQTCPPYGPAVPAFDYSAGDKETIRRLYGAPPTTITVTSNPVGLTVLVDGLSVTTPQVYSWPLYSTHTLGVATGVQTLPGEILNSYNPQRAATYYYTYGRWGDSTAQNHTISVVPETAAPCFPAPRRRSPRIRRISCNWCRIRRRSLRRVRARWRCRRSRRPTRERWASSSLRASKSSSRRRPMRVGPSTSSRMRPIGCPAASGRTRRPSSFRTPASA